MRAWWSGLSSREQALIAIAAALAALLLLTQIVVRPIISWRMAAEQRVEQAESGYRLVAQAAAVSSPGAAAAGASTPPRNALTDTARRMGVNLNFVNEHPDGSIEFQAGPVAPERAFELFAALERDFGVSVVAADITRSPEAPQQLRLQATVSR